MAEGQRSPAIEHYLSEDNPWNEFLITGKSRENDTNESCEHYFLELDEALAELTKGNFKTNGRLVSHKNSMQSRIDDGLMIVRLEQPKLS